MPIRTRDNIDLDMSDFFDAWRASLLGREATTEETYEAGWAGCKKAIKAYREYEQRIIDQERRQAGRDASWAGGARVFRD